MCLQHQLITHKEAAEQDVAVSLHLFSLIVLGVALTTSIFLDARLLWLPVQYLLLGGKAQALLDGRENVSCDDVKAVAFPVLRHRVLMNFEAEAENVKSDDIVQRLLETVKEPSENDY